ncbi:MAG: DivIVA domain-containing protein [Clostridia bacterium]|nr:DivIVA domain-containing protein [Clostridia bacterium]
MLAPHELKNKAFSKAVRGYSPTEVDDHIEFLIEKYTELYRENTELTRKLRIAVTKLDEIKDEEESIRSTLVNAQKMGEKIIKDANAQADLITGSIKERCDAIIADFKRRMVSEKEDLWAIRTAVLDFKTEVFELYRKHIEELHSINVNKIEDIVLPNENAIVEGIFGEVAEAVKNNTAAERAEAEKEDLNPEKEEKEPVEVPEMVVQPAVAAVSDSEDDDDGEDQFIKSLESLKNND